MKRSFLVAMMIVALPGCGSPSRSVGQGGSAGLAGAPGGAAGESGTGGGGAYGGAGGPGTGGAGGGAGASGLGGTAGMGAGPAGGAGGAVASCSADPTVGESAACDTCTADNCVPTTDGCSSALLASEEKRQNCLSLYCCLRTNHCKEGDALNCWCGDAAYGDCISRDTAANGTCLNEFRKAAESAVAATIKQRFVDPHYAIGGAVNLHVCRSSFCSRYSSPAGAPPNGCDL